jgi:hypothetical protein
LIPVKTKNLQKADKSDKSLLRGKQKTYKKKLKILKKVTKRKSLKTEKSLRKFKKLKKISIACRV